MIFSKLRKPPVTHNFQCLAMLFCSIASGKFRQGTLIADHVSLNWPIVANYMSTFISYSNIDCRQSLTAIIHLRLNSIPCGVPTHTIDSVYPVNCKAKYFFAIYFYSKGSFSKNGGRWLKTRYLWHLPEIPCSEPFQSDSTALPPWHG